MTVRSPETAKSRVRNPPIKAEITPDEQAFIEAHRNELPELETIDAESCTEKNLHVPVYFEVFAYILKVSGLLVPVSSSDCSPSTPGLSTW